LQPVLAAGDFLSVPDPAPEPLPSFRDPPVVEVVCSAGFSPVPGLTVGHFGRFWDLLDRRLFPACQEQVPLSQAIEAIGSQVPVATLELAVVPPRLWFISASTDEIVQVQRDRFLCNWRRVAQDHAYPRYDAVSGSFFERFTRYREFVRAETGNEIAFTQFELTYINHIAYDSVAQGFGGVGAFLPDLCWRSMQRFLPAPSGLEARLSFDLPDTRTRLHCKVNTGRRKDDGTPVIILDMTARGIGDDLTAWFALAHAWIVRGFADLTSSAAHERWGRDQ
jgi:uncharacterized protein (TIGR04255 family)